MLRSLKTLYPPCGIPSSSALNSVRSVLRETLKTTGTVECGSTQSSEPNHRSTVGIEGDWPERALKQQDQEKLQVQGTLSKDQDKSGNSKAG